MLRRLGVVTDGAERELIRYHREGKVGIVTIDRPEKRNAMTYAMLGQFIETVGRADHDPDTVVIVITGVPGAFCAGGNVDGFHPSLPPSVFSTQSNSDALGKLVCCKR